MASFKKTLVFTIDDGAVTCEASGFAGTACEAATRYFTDVLGSKVVKRVRKPEYFQKAKAGQGAEGQRQ